jgi:1-acyl-sn-glycerol-3-phosphate acyltransferase
VTAAQAAATILRSALFNAYFYGLTFVLGIYGVLLRLIDPTPSRIIGLAKLWARLALAGLRGICGIRVAVIGREHLPQTGPALIAAQHQSAFDTLIWVTLLPHVAYVLKRELTRIPLFGPLLHPSGQIVVDRSAGAAALRAMLRETERAVAMGYQVVIFPEGTRTSPGTRIPLQPGIAAQAARTGLPVIPAATDSGLFWGRRSFRKQPGTIHVVIGSPIQPGLAREELLQRLRRAWDTALADPLPVDKSVNRLRR